MGQFEASSFSRRKGSGLLKTPVSGFSSEQREQTKAPSPETKETGNKSSGSELILS
jgi:hypothetical protein